MSSVSRLRQLLDEFEATPASRGYDLRLSLADIVLERLDELGWTQRRLAEEAGMRESFLSRVIHADSNWTCDVAGRLLFALGARAELREVVASETVTGIDASEWRNLVTTALSTPDLPIATAKSTRDLDEIIYGQEKEDIPQLLYFETSGTKAREPQYQ